MLTKIKIEGLFNQFNYEIELKDNGLTILTGPNGYGKTTLLKIIYAFAVKDVGFFFKLPFKIIVLTQETSEIKLSKTEENTLVIQLDNGEPISYKYSDIIKEINRGLENSPYHRVDESRWMDRRTNTFYTFENLIQQWPEIDPEIQVKFQMPTIGDVYLIKEQRLIKNIATIRTHHAFEEMSNTIEEYALELSKNLNDILATASKIGQELDSSFPRRLSEEPEISLHVAWQKEVLNDLLKILKLQKIAIIVATHSPQIIGEHWDSVVDLWDLSKGISG